MGLSLFTRIAQRYRIARRSKQIEATRRRDLVGLLSNATRSQLQCPVCGGNCVDFSFEWNGDLINKAFCERCEHLFTNWRQTDAAENGRLFGYTEVNEGLAAQVQVLEEAAFWSGGGRVLDFGVGGNAASIDSARKIPAGVEYWGCDFHKIEHSRYFKTYTTEHLGSFSAISSHAVVEHLTDTLSSWVYLNKLLRPCSRGGGIMVHAFPSQYHHSMYDWQIVIRSHTCLFSRKSFPILLRRAGFRLVQSDPPRPVGPYCHPVFKFQKIADAE